MPHLPTSSYDSIDELVKENVVIEVYDTIFDHLVKYFKENTRPEDIFDDEELKEWAEENGYIKEETDATKE